MNPIVVRHLSEVEKSRIGDSPFKNQLALLKDILTPAIQEKASDTLLLFGLAGVGKTLLATELGHWAMELLPGYDGLFVDCQVASVVPDGDDAQAHSIVKSWLGDLSLFDGYAEHGWLFVLDNIESLAVQNQTTALIQSRIVQVLHDETVHSIVISTTRNPGAVDPALLARFGKRAYVSPPSIYQMSRWLQVGGMEYSTAARVSSEAYKLVSNSNMEYLAPEHLLKGWNNLSKGDIGAKPLNLAYRLCTGTGDLFIDQAAKDEYEQTNQYFITQSSLLNRMHMYNVT